MTIAKESGPQVGLLVETVEPESVAARAGIEVGDRLMALGDRSLWHVYQFAGLIDESTRATPVLHLLVEREGAYRAVVIGHRGGPLAVPEAGHAGHSHD
jgi:S1-C subfamily serine protease